MNPAHVEAGKNIRNAVVNKAILHSQRLELLRSVLAEHDIKSNGGRKGINKSAPNPIFVMDEYFLSVK